MRSQTRLTTNKQAHAEYQQAREMFLSKLLGAVSPAKKIDANTERVVDLVDAETGDEC